LTLSIRSAGKTIAHRPRPSGGKVFDLMNALKRSISPTPDEKPENGKNPGKAAAGQKEMLLPISGQKAGKQAAKKAAKAQRLLA
jgi:DNA end-binding protein Ku